MGIEKNDYNNQEEVEKTSEQLKFSRIRPVAYVYGLSMVTNIIVENEDGETTDFSLFGKWTIPRFPKPKPKNQDQKDSFTFDRMRAGFEFSDNLPKDFMNIEDLPTYIEELTTYLDNNK